MGTLDLSCNPVGLKGLKFLVSSVSVLTELKSLVLFNCSIEGHHQTMTESFIKLECFEANNITLAKLEELNLSHNQMTNIARTILDKKFGIIQD